ncbi:MAG: hypothetical protein ABJA10_00120 [Aestuariivirga sp.]
MPQKQITETTTQKRFIEFLIKYGDLEKASKAVHITPTQGKALMKSPDYLRLFMERYRIVLLTELAPQAILVISDMLSGRLKSDKVRSDLAKTVLDRIGLGAVKPEDPERGKGDMESMSVRDLEAHLGKLKEQAANNAKVIEHDAQQIPLDTDQPVDYME